MKKFLIALLPLVALAFTGCTATPPASTTAEPQHKHTLEVYRNDDKYTGKIITYCTDCKKVLDYDVLNYDSYQEADKVKEYKIALVEGKLYVKGEGNYIQVFIKD